MSANLLILLSLGVILIANVGVCAAVLRNEWYSPTQKALQCVLVWFLPVIGLIVVWCFLRSQSDAKPPDRAFQPQQDQGVSGPEFNHPGTPGMGD